MGRILCLLFIVLTEIKFVVLFEVQNLTSPCTDSNHLFLSPGVLSPGSSSRVCLSRFFADGPALFTLELLSEERQVATAARDLAAGDGGCLDIAVPQIATSKADLLVSISYPEWHCAWERRIPTRVARARSLVVLSERARYRPGDTVRVRIIVLRQDLTPSNGAIDEVWLESPHHTRAASWQRVRTRMGLAQVDHKLDDVAPPGRWTVRAKLYDGSQGAVSFLAGDYELPPFQLSVKHPPKVLRTSERLVWTVCVRYPWTEAVEGMLVIRIRGAPDSGAGIRTAVRLHAPRACHRHAAAARRVGLQGANGPDVVIADFSFQEEGTRVWQNTTVVSQVLDQAVTLEFLTKHRAIIAPGLPYKFKIKATRWDDKPAANERIKICRSPAKSQTEVIQPTTSHCDETDTDSDGLARVTFMVMDDGSDYYQFRASLKNDSSIEALPLFLPIKRTGYLHAALGPVKNDPQGSRTFVPLYLSLKNITRSLTVHFVVITRGGIIYRWGATTQCPTANTNNQIQVAPRNSFCSSYLIEDLKDFASNPTDSLIDRHLLRVMLPIKVTHQICPDSHLIAYFYYNGELVSASKYIEMDECFPNKVELTWQSRLTPPGSNTSLKISTPGPALCALSALDTAAKWTQPVENVKDIIIRGLRRLMEEYRNLTIYDAAGECFLTSENLDLHSDNGNLIEFWMVEAGVKIVGGNIVRSKICATAPAPMIAEDVVVPRSDFSESWLWRLVAISGNGSAAVTAKAPDCITRYEASAFCLSRTGLAVSTPAVLQVFREFFIHADSPKRLRRGDASIVRYRIFNYLYEPLSVQVQVQSDPHLEGPKASTELVCVNARSSVARRVDVRALSVGNARFSIKAKAVSGVCVNSTAGSGISDEVVIQLRVDPEGIPVRDHRSILLCGKDSKEAETSDVSWSWPAVDAVPGTEALVVWAVGNIAGPLLADADDLVLLPRGCGEQNMARLATSLLALEQLEPRSSAAATARAHVTRGLTRQLQYVHPDGGFSAFGASDATPSTWLTAFSVRFLRKAHQFLNPHQPLPPSINRAEQWLLSQQMENGCFRNEGQVFHRELKGGLNEEGEIGTVALTAYVLASLLNTSVLKSSILHNALHCLRALPLKSKAPNKVYAQSLLTYALVSLKRYEDEIRSANEASLRDGSDGLQQDEELRALVTLLGLARRKDDLVWWETGSLATSVEATGYALSALTSCPDQLHESCSRDARAALRWLSSHRNPTGGFVATQDTLVALEAITAWSKVSLAPTTNLNVTLRGSGETMLRLKGGDSVPTVVRMSGGKLAVHVEGSGCALIQATRSYNAHSADPSQTSKQLTVQTSVHTDGVFDCGVGGSCYCAAVVETCVVWTGAFPQMALLELSLPGGFGADAARLYAQLQEPNTLLRRIEMLPTSGRATLYLGSRDASATLGESGHQCFSMHAVGPAAKTKPTYVRVTDYYNPDVNDTQMYSIPEDCPARISREHKSNLYSASDNLFNKAKSQNDTDEIVIIDEFSFDDFPEGIPLEDPLYENLRKTDAENLVKKNIINDNVNIVEPTGKTNKVIASYSNIHEIKRNQGNKTRTHEQTLDDKLNVVKSIVDTNKIKESYSNTHEIAKTNRIAPKQTWPEAVESKIHESGQNKENKIAPQQTLPEAVKSNVHEIDENKANKIAPQQTLPETMKSNPHEIDENKANKIVLQQTLPETVKSNTHEIDENKANKIVPQQTVPETLTGKLDFRKSSEQIDVDYSNNTQSTQTKMRPIIVADNEISETVSEGTTVRALSIENPKAEEIRTTVKKEIPTIEEIRLSVSEEDSRTQQQPSYDIPILEQDIKNQEYERLQNVDEQNRLSFKDADAIQTDYISKDSTVAEPLNNLKLQQPQGSIGISDQIPQIYNKTPILRDPQDPKTVSKDSAIENPNLSSFYVIDSEKDLDVPSGVEGPVPSVVMPPPTMTGAVVVPPPPQSRALIRLRPTVPVSVLMPDTAYATPYKYERMTYELPWNWHTQAARSRMELHPVYVYHRRQPYNYRYLGHYNRDRFSF